MITEDDPLIALVLDDDGDYKPCIIPRSEVARMRAAVLIDAAMASFEFEGPRIKGRLTEEQHQNFRDFLIKETIMSMRLPKC
jgi:hypothetical protein